MLPDELFENRGIEEQIVSESDRQDDTVVGWTITDIKYGNGIRVYIEGADFPQKGFAPPEAVFSNNIVKRLILKGIELVNPLKSFNKIIENFTDIAWKVMNPYILKRQYLTPFSREIGDLSLNFLISYGIEANTAARFSKIVAHLFEYDNAYRLRAEDLFTMTTKEQLIKDPRGEIDNILKINQDREVLYGEVVAGKFKKIGWLMKLILLVPKVKKAFIEGIEKADFSNLTLDNIDKYWCCYRTDYLFMGMTYAEREKMLEEAGYKRVEGKRVKI